MAGASTFIPGLNPQHPHYLPGYSGHCPLLRFSMGQTYGQATAKLLQGAPGLAWPPAHRTLLPPIRPPSFPEVLIGRLPVRRGHERLSSSLVPGYTGFIPQAQFIFAKNCSQAWAEALSEFNQRHRGQGGHGRLEEVKGEKDPEKDQEAKLEVEKDPEPGQKAEQVRRRLLGSWGLAWVLQGLRPIPWMTKILKSSSCQALQEFGQMRAHGSSKGAARPPLPRIYPQNLGLLPHYGGYVPGYKFQFGRTYGHFTQNALGLSTVQKQLLT
ncbi:protein FAM166B isoform X5 [Sorex araneus]|uniref:protein FAM166B isoform X5 n=1 Tax=Sorex araneus TaxID=42254 RepID=UPI0024337DFA|nr:protein FAM166B isoform X5 [Sorex araneus]